MTKSISILALSVLFSLVACGPQDLILPDNPMDATKAQNQKTLLDNVYEGDEVTNRTKRLDIINEVEEDACQFYGEVVYASDSRECRYLIHLEDGLVINPVNFNGLDVKIRNGMAITLNYQLTRPDGVSCTLGEPAKITCITIYNPED